MAVQGLVLLLVVAVAVQEQQGQTLQLIKLEEQAERGAILYLLGIL
jgi:hypothetical protein